MVHVDVEAAMSGVSRFGQRKGGVTYSKQVCVGVRVFIKLHLTAQSEPVVLIVILCHSHWSSQGGINDTVCVCVCVCIY